MKIRLKSDNINPFGGLFSIIWQLLKYLYGAQMEPDAEAPGEFCPKLQAV